MAQNENPLFIYLSTYDSEADATADFEAVQQLHRDGLVGLYDAAEVTRDDDGDVHVKQRETPTEHGALAGLGIGAAAGAEIAALIGAFFPPYLLAGAALGALDGGVIRHLRDGLPRDGLKELGESLNDGTAALVVVGESTVSDAIAKAVTHAKKQLAKQLYFP